MSDQYAGWIREALRWPGASDTPDTTPQHQVDVMRHPSADEDIPVAYLALINLK